MAVAVWPTFKHVMLAVAAVASNIRELIIPNMTRAVWIKGYRMKQKGICIGEGKQSVGVFAFYWA